MQAPNRKAIQANGIEFNVWHWLGVSRQACLFVHATGFHGRIWDQVIFELPGYQCYAMDMRGHGLTQQMQHPHSWRESGRDVSSLASALGLRAAVGIGHSMGGHSLCLAAAERPELFSALILIDPVIMEERFYRAIGSPPLDFSEHPVARRKNQWLSSAEMFERFKNRPPFNRWNQEVLHDYCQYGLSPREDGQGFKLACAPLFEAGIYAASRAHDAFIQPELAKIAVPVLVIRLGTPMAEEALNFDVSPADPKLASYFDQGTDLHFPEYTHFMPMEAPASIAKSIEDFLGGSQ